MRLGVSCSALFGFFSDAAENALECLQIRNMPNEEDQNQDGSHVESNGLTNSVINSKFS